MTDILLFPMTEYWSFYVGFAVFVLAMLALDLGVFHRNAHEVSIREAAIWSAVWVGLALAFNAALYYYMIANGSGTENSNPRRPIEMSNTLTLSPDELLTTTRAVRKRLDFDRPVSLALIKECLEIALQAPTGSNAQGWQWMVVQDPAKRLALAELYRKAWAIYPSMAASAHQVHKADPSMQEVQERVVSSAEYLANNLEKAPVFVIPCIGGRVENIPAPMGVVAQASTYGSILPAA